MDPKEKHVKWMREYLARLEGATIEKVEVTDPNDDWADGYGGFPKLTVRTAVEHGGELFTLEVAQDEEGNGPGFIFGLPFPQDEKKLLTR